jgi:hypothetical protein
MESTIFISIKLDWRVGVDSLSSGLLSVPDFLGVLGSESDLSELIFTLLLLCKKDSNCVWEICNCSTKSILNWLFSDRSFWSSSILVLISEVLLPGALDKSPSNVEISFL